MLAKYEFVTSGTETPHAPEGFPIRERVTTLGTVVQFKVLGQIDAS